ncbi:MAG TPA: murein biosynthesis integral membrane protein MurJ [Actinomycetota bacterium]|nr:murein biosynthesis integral membrane protein MurJ [Actinomycetota bacterium]
MRRSLARASAVMTVGTVLSRVTGLLRLAAIVAAIGVAESKLADTFNLANTAPNIIYELVLGGVLTSVFVPVFVELLQEEGKERAWRVISAVMNLSVVILVAITTLAVLAAPWIARFYAARCNGCAVQQQEVLTFLLRMFLPQIVFYGLAALTAGLLNANRRFAAPMYTPVLNNLAVIGVFLAFYNAYGRVTLDGITRSQLLLIGLGTTGGVILMAIAQVPFMRGLGRYQLTFDASHPAVKKLVKLSAFVIAYVITNQIGYLTVQWLANRQQGGYSAYVAAFTFFILPQGLFAVSIFTALLPSMSEHAVNERWAEFRERLSMGVRSTFFLILPAAVGYFVLGEPVVRLLQHGVMTPRSTELVASVLRIFVLGLVPFSIYQLFLRAFYAIQDTRTPFLINCVTTVVNIGINIPMFGVWGVRGLALGHAASYTVGVVLQARALRRRVGGLDLAHVTRSAAKVAVAAVGMGALVWLVSRVAESLITPTGFAQQVALVVAPVAVGAVAYLGLAALVQAEELVQVRGLVARRST